ncbi:MAG TPA: F0F1 ATP synthase subunit gamma, partial [Acidimicrobiales bacterium]|nr:F0F1 ATP synthase subunit gamma [Acidimicrobiales bacterium]
MESTKKITRAMELISASRIVKAQQKVNAARPYAEQITEVIGNLAAAGAGSDQPLLTPRENVSNVGVIVLSADRGLAGGFNSAVIRKGEQALKDA